MWIYQRKSWPNFTWDANTLADQLAELHHAQGKLLGRMEGLGFEFKQEASLNILTSDIVKSSAIEGEHLNPTEVRSSIARHLGIDIAGLVPASRHVDGIVEMMLDATQHFSKPLTKARLCHWHAALFPTGYSGISPIIVGRWRTPDLGPMQVVSGPIGREKVHFEAPHAEQLDHEIKSFLTWFEKKEKCDPVIKAGLAHFWFVTIHPFEDGNGRIARAIGDMALARADGIADRFYSLSTQIGAERKMYYQQLEMQQRGTLDVTNWLSWFLDCLGRAITNAEEIISHVLYKVKLWDKLNQVSINERQRLIVNRMLEIDFEGYINTSKYAKLAKCSSDTALRDIQELKAAGILLQNPGGGRSTSYRLISENEM